MKITDDIFKFIFNEGVWISITISLKFVPKGQIDYKSALVQVMPWHRTGEKPLPESMLTKFTDAYIRHYEELKYPSQERSFHWGLVHLAQSASLCWNSPKIFHTVFETLPVGAKSLPILPPDYWQPPRAISQNISKMRWQFFMHLSMVNEFISKPCTSWVSVS